MRCSLALFDTLLHLSRRSIQAYLFNKATVHTPATYSIPSHLQLLKWVFFSWINHACLAFFQLLNLWPFNVLLLYYSSCHIQSVVLADYAAWNMHNNCLFICSNLFVCNLILLDCRCALISKCLDKLNLLFSEWFRFYCFASYCKYKVLGQ